MAPTIDTLLVRRLRLAVGLVWVAIVLALLALVATQALAPRLGHQLYVIRGASMAPAIPLGAVVAVQTVAAETLRVGDIITVQSSTGVVFSHRIVAIEEGEAGPRFQIKGDANASIDAGLVPASAVIGRVVLHLPVLGYFLALLTMPTGIISVLSGLGSLLLAFWLLEDLEREDAARAAQPAPSPWAARA